MTVIRLPRRCGCDGDDCTLLAVDDRHGTPHGYRRCLCRCADCRHANTEERLSSIERMMDQGRTCPNCDGPPGRYAGGTCDACYRYRRAHGRPRPPVPGLLVDEHRHCTNCGKRMLRARALRHGRCMACARFWDRNGHERPSERWRPLEADAADDDHLDRGDAQAVAS